MLLRTVIIKLTADKTGGGKACLCYIMKHFVELMLHDYAVSVRQIGLIHI